MRYTSRRGLVHDCPLSREALKDRRWRTTRCGQKIDTTNGMDIDFSSIVTCKNCVHAIRRNAKHSLRSIGEVILTQAMKEVIEAAKALRAKGHYDNCDAKTWCPAPECACDYIYDMGKKLDAALAKLEIQDD